MKKFMIKVRWSWTDDASYLVHAKNREEALEKTKSRIPGARYYDYYGEMMGEIQ